MTSWRVLTALIVAAASLPVPVLAQQALVRSYQNTSLEIGQAYLVHYGDRCLAILPTHVADEAGNVAALLREGTSPLLGETSAIAELGDDVSVADLIGGITGDCGFSTLAVSRAVDRKIKANAVAGIRSVNGDGSIAQLSVAIVDDDGSTFLRVQPTNDANQLRKGQSGSLLMAGDAPIGMLLSVNARFGVGKVIRLDAMFAKLDAHLRGGDALRVTANVAAQPSGQRTTTVTRAITSWSAMAVDAEHRAVNLVAADDALAWIATVDTWPVELELEIPGGRVAIAGVELDASGDAAANRPATVELLISSTVDGRRWRSVAGGGLNYVEGRATINIAPTWARQVKLIISAAAGEENTVSLYRLNILPAN